MIPHNKPTLGQEESKAVQEVLSSGWIAQGAKVQKFEDAMCRYTGMPEGSAVAVSSGTAALYMALVALGIKKGSEVILPTYTCSAVLNAVNLAGATPVLVDVNEYDLNISFADTKKKISKKTGAIIITHTFGMPADVRQFKSLGVPVIEDCAQALGSNTYGAHAGHTGDISVFSFYASKMITTGYGGMVLSRNKKLIRTVKDYREFDGRADYKQRFNFSMSDMQAALGLAQLKKLPGFLNKRKEIYRRYAKTLPAHLLLWPVPLQKRMPNRYRILLRVPDAKKLQIWLEKKGIRTIVPIERFELLHRYLHKNPRNFPVSELNAQHLLSLPAYPSLSIKDQNSVISAVKEFYRHI